MIPLVALLLTASALLIGWREWREERGLDMAAEARAAHAVCERLLDLLGKLQQHRGMSNAWRAGDPEFGVRMLEMRRDIAGHLAALSESKLVATDRLRPCMNRDQLAQFCFRWRTLGLKLHRMSIEQSFAQQSCLIGVVLNWLGSIGEIHIAARLGRALPANVVANFSRRLPALAECLAQARGIGSTVAAKSGCSPVARVRLMLLIGRAESLLQQVGDGGSPGPEEALARQAVRTMGQLVRRNMLASSGIGVSAERYFELTTQAIDAVLAWTRAYGMEVESCLRRLADPLRQGATLADAALR